MDDSAADVTSRGAAVEYWFVKLHVRDLAFLVDFIVRRRTGEAEARLSLWLRREGRVVRFRTPSWRVSGPHIAIGENVFAPERSSGRVDDVEWDLRYGAGPAHVAPATPLLQTLHPFDLELISRPRARFEGSIHVAGDRFELSDIGGTLTHYWGRRLPDTWRWLSANGFSGTDLSVECVLMSTRLWGKRPTLSAAYLWMQDHRGQRLMISPATGLLRAEGPPTSFTVIGRDLRGMVRLQCSAAADRFNDLGEGIHQTLLGTCSIAETGSFTSTAGLEFRS